jgi:hypothetical protein
MPNRSPKVKTTITRGTATSKPPKAANTNVSRTAREAAIRAKYPPADKGWKLISGKYAYGPKPPSMASKVAKVAKSVAGGVARGAGRLAGPVGALVSMTTPAGAGSDKPKGPLMSGNKSRGPGGGSLSAPNRTTPSRSGGASNSKGPAGPLGANSGPSRSGGASNSKGPAGPLGANSGPSRSTTSSKGPSRGPTSAPSRTAPSKANLGTSRF